MNENLVKVLLFLLFVITPSFALELNAVFENQKKAAFPDTCEMQMNTIVTFPGQLAQTVETTVITAGEDKSLTTIKSNFMQMRIVQNGGRMKVTDLKTGKSLPAQGLPQQNPADVNKQMGNPENYKAPVAEGALWKLLPKETSKPTLYYSSKLKRVIKMEVLINGVNSISEFEYCDNSCPLPGTLKKVTIKTLNPQGGESTVVLEILKAKQRHVLPTKMFDVE